jgi:transcriptional activator SPT7
MGLDDYPDVIKRPMDLSTLKKNLKKCVYKKRKEFISDLFLIWENCKNYNIDGSVCYIS